jgi:ankyrin repeat protein
MKRKAEDTNKGNTENQDKGEKFAKIVGELLQESYLNTNENKTRELYERIGYFKQDIWNAANFYKNKKGAEEIYNFLENFIIELNNQQPKEKEVEGFWENTGNFINAFFRKDETNQLHQLAQNNRLSENRRQLINLGHIVNAFDRSVENLQHKFHSDSDPYVTQLLNAIAPNGPEFKYQEPSVFYTMSGGETEQNGRIWANQDNIAKLRARLDQISQGINSVLLANVKDGDTQGIELAMKFRADINCRSTENKTPLEYAESNPELFSYLVEKYNPDLSVKDANGNTFLDRAVKARDTERCRVLLKHNAPAKQTSYYEPNLLHIAASNGDLEIAKMLIENGKVDKDSILYHWDGYLNKFAEFFKGIINSVKKIFGAQVVEFQGDTALHIAAKNKHFHLVDYLQENGVNTKILDKDGMSYAYYDVRHIPTPSAPPLEAEIQAETPSNFWQQGLSSNKVAKQEKVESLYPDLWADQEYKKDYFKRTQEQSAYPQLFG